MVLKLDQGLLVFIALIQQTIGQYNFPTVFILLL